MLDASHDCVVAITGDGSVAAWNRASEETFGYSRGDAIGADLAELIVPPSARDRHRQALAASVSGGGGSMLDRRIELIAMRAGGEEFPVELTITRVEGPEPVFVGFIRDLTARAAQTRRREVISAIGQRAQTSTRFEEIPAEVAEVARTELELDACTVWARRDEAGPLELIASAGEVNGSRASKPGMANNGGSAIGVGGSIEHTFSIGGRIAGVFAMHGARRLQLDHPDRTFVDDLGQILTGVISRARAEHALAEAERRYRGMLERLPVVSYLAEYGPGGQWLYVSPQVEQLLGYPPEDWLADRDLWWRLVHPDDRVRVAAEEQRCAKTLQPLSVEYRMIARDGRIVWIRDQGSMGRPVNGEAVQVDGVMMDVTDRRQAVEELRHHAEHDELTGLANRRRFTEELRHRRSGPGATGAVAIFDVDDLKHVNDSLGHAAGDAMLRCVATALSGVLQPGEFLARFGGDEFTILLEASTQEAIQGRLAAFLDSVRTCRSPSARATAGAAGFDADTQTTDEGLIVAADIALNKAKEHGGDRYSVCAGEHYERLAWVGRVREGIENDQLCVYAQPIVRVSTGECVGSELLVRMTEEDGTVLAPAAFLPTAERFGLIRDVDRWVIEKAISIAAEDRLVAINISARSISDPALTERIKKALADTGADPANVVFEITETAAASAIEDLKSFGARVERLGCALAIDDFGTGFGSLTYLRHLPVRYLKIDMAFVQGMTSSAADRAIVESITTIARSLGMKTVGEGVEDAATLDALRACGVDFAQGFHLGQPMPVPSLGDACNQANQASNESLVIPRTTTRPRPRGLAAAS